MAANKVSWQDAVVTAVRQYEEGCITDEEARNAIIYACSMQSEGHDTVDGPALKPEEIEAIWNDAVDLMPRLKASGITLVDGIKRLLLFEGDPKTSLDNCIDSALAEVMTSDLVDYVNLKKGS